MMRMMRTKILHPSLQSRWTRKITNLCVYRLRRADGNTIFYEMFKTLKNIHLKDTDAVFRSYTGHMTRALGMCKLDLNVSKLICGDKFFVTQPKMQDEPVILGRMWQRKYNCFIDWPQRLAHCQSFEN